MLTHQLGYFNILPMYVALLLWSPAIFAMARFSPTLALGVSVAIYVAARFFGLALPNWPEPGTWFFNPLSWQLIFTLGIVSCLLWRERPIPGSPALFRMAVALLLVAAFAVTDGFGLAPGLHNAAFSHLDLLKQTLGVARLIHFVALAYVIWQISVAAAERSWIGGELRRLGRHSLPIFALGSVLSCVGQAAMQVVGVKFSGAAPEIGLVYTSFGIFGLFLFARYLERHDSGYSWQTVLAGRPIAALRPAFSRASHSLSQFMRSTRR